MPSCQKQKNSTYPPKVKYDKYVGFDVDSKIGIYVIQHSK